MSFIVGTDGPETLNGTPGADDIYGLNEDDVLNGLAGNDFLDGGAGNDVMSGGAGDDTYMVDSLADVIGEDEDEGNDIVYAQATYVLSASAWVEVLAAIDNSATTELDLTGNDHTHALLGNNGINTLTGGALGEILVGYGGQDGLYGGGGNDFLYGMTDSDLLSGGAGNDYLEGGAAADTLIGGLDNDVYLVADADDFITEVAGEGTDLVWATTSYVLDAAASVELLSTVENAGTLAINLTGSNLGGTILGNNGFNTLSGRAGEDVILGFGGRDIIEGGSGSGRNRLFGMDGNDLLRGGLGDDYLDGGAGADEMIGSGGDDIFIIDDSGDATSDSNGAGDHDIIYTSADTHMGGYIEAMLAIDNTSTAPLRLWGSFGDEIIFANAGNNFLDGGGGVDWLAGYGGADIFNFSEVGNIDPNVFGASPPQIDFIQDFTPGEDRIRLDTTKFTTMLGLTGYLENAAAATSAATRILYDPATGLVSYDSDGNGSASAKAFARLSTGLTLHESDFIIEANSAPEANPDVYELGFTSQGGGMDIHIKLNDFDDDGYGIWVTKFGVPGQPMVTVGTGLGPTVLHGTYGTLAGGGKGNSFSYSVDMADPDTQALAIGQTVTETFVYEVTDGMRITSTSYTIADFALYSTSTITLKITRLDTGAVTSSVEVQDSAKSDGGGHALAAAAPDGPPADALRADAMFEDHGARHDLRLMIAAQLDQPEMLGHHPQLA
jgi:VCBS repeat-containing protein